MHKYSIVPAIIIVLMSLNISAQSYYRISFTDKKGTPWSMSYPSAWLSERALERRERQNIRIDSLDLPVNPHYIDQVLQYDVSFVHASKWMNSITVKSNSGILPEEISQLPFVREVVLTKRELYRRSLQSKFIEMPLKGENISVDPQPYGASAGQVFQVNAQYLHDNGYNGDGLHIAVLDAGFTGVEEFAAFDSLRIEGRIAGTYDFVDGDTDVYNDFYHGMSVLSVMAGNLPGQLIGTATGATYWLLRSEDAASEFLIEEDNWVVAAEFADSAGADIINSSLGYTTFDDSSMDHTYADMDGNTTYVTRGANIAVSRGILVFSSAGNEGSPGNPWKYISAPSDGDQVIGVGAVDTDGKPASFSSYGPASDGDVKPNVSATGNNTILQRSDNTIGPGNGTSYSSPVMAGAAASLWQANRDATAIEVKIAIEKSAHLYLSPDSVLGYGIPDMATADQLLKSLKNYKGKEKGIWRAWPNPASNYLILEKQTQPTGEKIKIAFYSTPGVLLHIEEHTDAAKIILSDLKNLPPGILILHLYSQERTDVVKIIKSR